ncbi:unnamed protein product [Penicillium roqueforti FM164]|uniref:Genomic scaffold, ProqFM164S04 n=1 Tax=Penicillium roqueforti (strain FM164) TaxID=1365484 RepID=W6R1H1_PENRF|nr:unnamed protein product [Penicillium roqueforti FM164]
MVHIWDLPAPKVTGPEKKERKNTPASREIRNEKGTVSTPVYQASVSKFSTPKYEATTVRSENLRPASALRAVVADSAVSFSQRRVHGGGSSSRESFRTWRIPRSHPPRFLRNLRH